MTTSLQMLCLMVLGIVLLLTSCTSQREPPSVAQTNTTPQVLSPTKATHHAQVISAGVVQTHSAQSMDVCSNVEAFAMQIAPANAPSVDSILARLAQSNVWTMESIENQLTHCHDTRVVEQVLSNLAVQVRSQQCRVVFALPEDVAKCLPNDVAAYCCRSMAALNADCMSAAAQIEIRRAQNALRGDLVDNAISILKTEIQRAQLTPDTYAELYQTLAIAHNYEESYQAEADAQEHAFLITLQARDKTPPFIFTQSCKVYLAALANAGEFDKANKLLNELRDDGYTLEQVVEDEVYHDIADRDKEKTKRRL